MEALDGPRDHNRRNNNPYEALVMKLPNSLTDSF